MLPACYWMRSAHTKSFCASLVRRNCFSQIAHYQRICKMLLHKHGNRFNPMWRQMRFIPFLIIFNTLKKNLKERHENHILRCKVPFNTMFCRLDILLSEDIPRRRYQPSKFGILQHCFSFLLLVSLPAWRANEKCVNVWFLGVNVIAYLDDWLGSDWCLNFISEFLGELNEQHFNFSHCEWLLLL